MTHHGSNIAGRQVSDVHNGTRERDELTVQEDSAFGERLEREVKDWQGEGLIRPEQAEEILARYGRVPGENQRSVRQSRLVWVLAFLGVILVGVGVVLVLGSNWQAIPKAVRLALLVGATAASYHAGYVMSYRSQKYPKVGGALLLLGSLLWGASIFLVGQMYSTGGSGGEDQAVFFWFVGVIPLAYVLVSRLHLALGVVLGVTWLVMSANRYQSAEMVVPVLVAAGLGLYSLGRLHSSSPRFSTLQWPYRTLGLLVSLTCIYILSFKWFWESWGYRGSHAASMLVAEPYVWTAAALLLAALALVDSVRRREKGAPYEMLGVLLLILTSASFAVFVRNPADWMGAVVVFNLALFVSEIGLVTLGWVRNEPALANIGIAFFALQVFTRYFDLFGSMLNSGMLFIGAGLLLVVGGFVLERYRRGLLAQIAERGAL